MQLLGDHRDALFDALKKTEIDANIPMAKFVELVNNLDIDLVCNMLCFQDNELPSEYVIEKNLGLYIRVNIYGIPIKKALIDTDFNVNVCSVELLQKYFPFIYEKLKITNISIK